MSSSRGRFLRQTKLPFKPLVDITNIAVNSRDDVRFNRDHPAPFLNADSNKRQKTSGSKILDAAKFTAVSKASALPVSQDHDKGSEYSHSGSGINDNEPDSDCDNSESESPEPKASDRNQCVGCKVESELKKFLETQFPYEDEYGTRVAARSTWIHKPDIRSVPRTEFVSNVRYKMSQHRHRKDGRLPGASKPAVDGAIDQLVPCLEATMEISDNMKLRRHCDYSGALLSWTPGPRSMSLEAIYPFIPRSSTLGYHMFPNVCIVTSFLNWARRSLPPVSLALVACWIRAYDNPAPDFKVQKGKMLWLYTAICNASTMSSVFSCRGDSKRKFAKWALWDIENQKAVLETLRTGSKTDVLTNALNEYPKQKLFCVKGKHTNPKPVSREERYEWNKVYENMRRLALKMGLSADEFDYHCSIPAPGKKNGRVFYPFYILSKPQAVASSWDWNHVFDYAKRSLATMNNTCNRHAKTHGLTETHVDETMFIYWIAAIFIEMILKAKARRPAATAEEIAFAILDTWDCFIVPWMGNIFRASVCKAKDHGITMVTGILDPKGQPFDPLVHIDLAKCNIRIDAQMTNMAMFNYIPELWPHLRENLKRVPQHHPFWRIDPTMGNELWGGKSDTAIIPEPPTPDFDMQLWPIDIWFQDDTPQLPLNECQTCDQAFQNIGLLILHNQEEHSKQGWSQFPSPDIPEQNAKDELFWKEKLKCPYCFKIYGNWNALTTHMHMKHQDKKPYPHRCDWPECGLGFLLEKDLIKHKHSHIFDYSIEILKCDFLGCIEEFQSQTEFDEHQKIHEKTHPFACDWQEPKCNRRFTKAEDLRVHMKIHTVPATIRCKAEAEGCKRLFRDVKSANMHYKTAHGDKLICEEPDCGVVFSTKYSLERHIQMYHRDFKKFECKWPGCDQKCISQTDLQKHWATHTGQKKYPCLEAGCPKSFGQQGHLDDHIAYTHRGEKNYICQTCNMDFANKRGLVRHQKRFNH